MPILFNFFLYHFIGVLLGYINGCSYLIRFTVRQNIHYKAHFKPQASKHNKSTIFNTTRGTIEAQSAQQNRIKDKTL